MALHLLTYAAVMFGVGDGLRGWGGDEGGCGWGGGIFVLKVYSQYCVYVCVLGRGGEMFDNLHWFDSILTRNHSELLS
jgi:hypothetical protein